MMQLLRDEHGLIVNFVKAGVANKRNQAVVDQWAQRAAPEAPPAVQVARPVSPLGRTMVVPTTSPKPAAPSAKNPVVGASMPPLNDATAQQNDPAPQPNSSGDNSLLTRTIDFNDHAVAATQGAVSAIGAIAVRLVIGDRVGVEAATPREPGQRIVSRADFGEAIAGMECRALAIGPKGIRLVDRSSHTSSRSVSILVAVN
jgi:hypothetical protein